MPNKNQTPQILTQEEQAKLEELCLFAFDCARENDVQSLKTLLDSGLNVNLANDKGNTLVMLASYNGNFEATKLLLESGAQVDKKNDKNLTPLAGVTFKGYYDIAKLLLDFGANPLETSGKGLSPMNCAIFFGRKEFITLFAPYTKGRLSLFQKIFAWIYRALFPSPKP